jgi:hypothetical protein
LILANDPSGSTGQLITSVHDQFLDFLVPSSNLFSLLPRREIKIEANGTVGKKGAKPKEKEVEGRASYAVLNDPRANELQIEEEIDRVARGLFSVIVTMGWYCINYVSGNRGRTDAQRSLRSFDVPEGTRPRWSLVGLMPN